MNAYLLIDFGSTFTKITAIDIDREVILGTAKALTTVETDIMIGYEHAMSQLNQQLEGQQVQYVKRLACSSAAGGLKMVAIGLVPELTAEAAKRAALGAGARVLKVFDHDLTRRDMEKLIGLQPDMILLAGGTDGGNRECMINNARMLAEYDIKIPLVIAGNKSAVDDVEVILTNKGLIYSVTDNVMPRLNVLQVEPARETIREIFMERITYAKGMHLAKDMAGGILMPTPAAVLKAAELLSVGTDLEDGLGDLVVIDIGGATTDVHSLTTGEPTKPGITLKGLEEPFAKRTVEGDLGMRYSALSLWEASGSRKIQKYLQHQDVNIQEACRRLSLEVNRVAETPSEVELDEALAKVAVEISLQRHAGMVETTYTPLGVVFTQTGKDLTPINYLIGTGGIFVGSADPAALLQAGLYDAENPVLLKPQNPRLMLDARYILSAMGLLAQDFPDMALRIMKKTLIDCKREGE